MTTANFEPLAEVVADHRGRIPLGRIGVGRRERFLLSKNASGSILLTPAAQIPAREHLIFRDKAVRESLHRGIADVAAGRVSEGDDILDDVSLP